MRTKNDQIIAPGVYLYYAKTPDGDEATGRFLVIKWLETRISSFKFPRLLQKGGQED